MTVAMKMRTAPHLVRQWPFRDIEEVHGYMEADAATTEWYRMDAARKAKRK